MLGMLAAVLVLAGELPQIMPPPPTGLPPPAADGSTVDTRSDYPERALRLEREGRVELSCMVREDGSVGGCEIASETPPDMGFGQAALRMSRRFRMTPEMRDGKPVVSSRPVRIPVTFKLPYEPPPVPAPVRVPLTYEEAVMCHNLFARRVLYLQRSADAPRRAAARTLALNLGRAQGLSTATVERRPKREPGSAVYDEQQLERCEMVPAPRPG